MVFKSHKIMLYDSITTVHMFIHIIDTEFYLINSRYKFNLCNMIEQIFNISGSFYLPLLMVFFDHIYDCDLIPF